MNGVLYYIYYKVGKKRMKEISQINIYTFDLH